MILSDPCLNNAALNLGLSSGYLFDRTSITPSRVNFNTYFNDNFVALPGANVWASVPSSGANEPLIVTTGSGAAATATALQLTAACVGSDSHIGGAFTSGLSPISAYGVMFCPAQLAIGPDIADALKLIWQDGRNRYFEISHYGGGVSVLNAAGGQTLLTSHINTSWCEYWYEISAPDPSGYTTVSTYCGSSYMGAVVLALPLGGPGTSGLVQIQQMAGATANRQSWVSQLAFGLTQTSDNLLACYGPIETPYAATKLILSMILEDICEGCFPTASVQIDNGSFTPVTLTKHTPAIVVGGVIDNAKTVSFYSGVLVASVTAKQLLRPRFNLPNAQFGAIHGIGLDFTALAE